MLLVCVLGCWIASKPKSVWLHAGLSIMCTTVQEGWLRLDAHIMATPAIGDLNGDGHEELVVGVSWFFDREYYEDPVGTFPLFYAPTSHCP